MGRNQGEQEYEWNRRSFGGYVIYILLLTSASSHHELEQKLHPEGKRQQYTIIKIKNPRWRFSLVAEAP